MIVDVIDRFDSEELAKVRMEEVREMYEMVLVVKRDDGWFVQGYKDA